MRDGPEPLVLDLTSMSLKELIDEHRRLQSSTPQLVDGHGRARAAQPGQVGPYTRLGIAVHNELEQRIKALDLLPSGTVVDEYMNPTPVFACRPDKTYYLKGTTPEYKGEVLLEASKSDHFKHTEWKGPGKKSRRERKAGR